MSKWDQYAIATPAASQSRWDKYALLPKSQTTKPKTEQSPQGDNYASVLGKSFNRAALGLVDLPNTLAYGAEGLSNLTRKGYGKLTGQEPGSSNYFPSPTPATDYVANKANKLGYEGFNVPVADTPGKKIVAGIGSGLGSAVSGLGLGAAAQIANAPKVANFLGASNPTQTLVGSGIAGGTTAGLEEAGVDPITANIAGAFAPSALMGAGKLAKNTLKGAANAYKHGTKLEAKVLGLTPGKLDTDLLEAANRLNIEIPTAAATDAKAIGWGEQFAGRVPFIGDKIKKKYASTEQQFLENLQKIYDNTGSVATPDIENQIANLYDKAATTLPKEAAVKPKRTLSTIRDIEKKLVTASPSASEKQLIQELDNIKNAFGEKTKFGSINAPVPVEMLIGTKKSLNSTIKWDVDEGVKNMLRKVQNSLLEDIKEYGSANPEWYKYFKDSDALYGKVARREQLENILSKGINDASGDMSYNALSKVIHNKKSAGKIQRLVGTEDFKKLKDLGTVARAMSNKNKNNPNPSGTAFTAGIAGLLGGLMTAPLTTVSTVVTANRLSHLLTDQKFLDMALKYSKETMRGRVNPAIEKTLSERIKDLTGKSADVIAQELNKVSPNALPAAQNIIKSGEERRKKLPTIHVRNQRGL